MLKLNKACGLLGLSFVLSFIGLFGGYNAYAASAYDTVIPQPVDKIELTEFNTFTNKMDITTDWSQYILTEDYNSLTTQTTGNASGQLATVRQALLNRIAEGDGWSVVQYGANVRITVDDDGDNVYNFTPDGLVTTGGAYMIALAWYEQQEIMSVQVDYQSYDFMAYNFNETEWSIPFIMPLDIVYPAGYEGVVPPMTAEPPVEEPEVEIPDLQNDISLFYKKNDKTITLVNKTPQPPLDTATMMCEYIISKPDFAGNALDVITPCQESNYQEITVEDYGVYQVKFNILYDINGDTVILSGENIAELQVFNLDINGSYDEGMAGGSWISSHYDLFNNCVTDTFPFMNFSECSKGMARVGNLLSFDRLNFGNEWEVNEGCRTLSEIGEWIPIEDKEVCPQFSETVRNTVTPFVTLSLGLVMLGFVTRQGGSGFA